MNPILCGNHDNHSITKCFFANFDVSKMLVLMKPVLYGNRALIAFLPTIEKNLVKELAILSSGTSEIV